MSYRCPDCPRRNFRSSRGLTQHRNAHHRDLSPVSDPDENPATSTTVLHPFLNAKPCDVNGRYLPPSSPPSFDPTAHLDTSDDRPSWRPFNSRKDFDFAYFHFVEAQSSESQVNKALDIWAAQVYEYGGKPPWQNAKDLYHTIDSIQAGDAPWKAYKIKYTGPLPANGTPPKWMTETYELCTRDTETVLRNQLESPEFRDAMNLVPYRQFNKEGHRLWSNLMSADWAWKQANMISDDVSTHGATFIPVIAGSDKTTVSVATGHQEFHPVYMSPGVLTNTARRAHGNAGMTTPRVVQFADGHFRRAVFGLGPYIADYPEQVWLSGIVQGWCPKCDARPEKLDASGALPRSPAKTAYLKQSFPASTLWSDFGVRSDVLPFTHRFPRANIHDLLSPDLLHQVIKGTFKDHIVTWVNEYLHLKHGEAGGNVIIDDIDRRISAVPIFAGLRRFPDGRDFSQWTGDDSKALMKVYLAAISGHVPPAMVKCLAAFLDFCYLARRNVISANTLSQLESALARFHVYRQIFIDEGVRESDISLPRQHSLKHYSRSIRLFGSPNGLCSSITESKHIKAVKIPWRRSNRFNALLQMLRTNCRLDKMATIYEAFAARNMMEGSTLSYTVRVLEGDDPSTPFFEAHENNEEDGGPIMGPKVLSSIQLAKTPRNFFFAIFFWFLVADLCPNIERGYPNTLDDVARDIDQPRLPELTRRFLYDQLNPVAALSSADVELEQCPRVPGPISVFHSAVAQFYAPSDLCGDGGMRREFIRSCPLWRGEHPRRDTVFITTHSEEEGMHGMVTGMWVVKPEYTPSGRRSLAVVHLDSIARVAHLLPVYGPSVLPEDLHFSQSLDAFRAFYVSRYADHHMHEFLA
ncbi:hypothetical protein HYDPIDRAFT_92089 [Hydnomerulius pinastri MD-312]|uniref:C2H2-type domain-containing protein n=1 Tax=Hydnomerulius pinastri MD-312 TaxID=994086 RepID=A0A0C9VDC3_9AGAM|nr:hypothetical protein HYDPIDRAFT_92089 [Hydnomerulius pinastri MD-312]